jgi:hypothetical protein
MSLGQQMNGGVADADAIAASADAVGHPLRTFDAFAAELTGPDPNQVSGGEVERNRLFDAISPVPRSALLMRDRDDLDQRCILIDSVMEHIRESSQWDSAVNCQFPAFLNIETCY